MSAVITGLGVAAPTGLGLREHWAATLAGTSAIGPVARCEAGGYSCTLAGEVPGFVPEEHLSGRLIPQTDHMTRMALAASDWRWRTPGWTRPPGTRTGWVWSPRVPPAGSSSGSGNWRTSPRAVRGT